MLTALLFCLSADPAWPRVFGPDLTRGAAVTDADVPVTWSETQNVRWKAPVAGTGWSSPVVLGGRIYVTTAVPQTEVQSTTDKATRSLRLIGLNAETGETEVDAEVFTQPPGDLVEIHGKNSHASPTPLVVGGDLVVHFGPHGTARVRPDGEVVWRATVPPYAAQHGNGGSPELFGDVLVVCCDGRDEQFVVGLSAETGELLWRTDRGLDPGRGFSFGTPVPIEVDGERLAVCQGSGAVMALDPQTGAEVWRVRYGEGYSVVPRPAYDAATQTLYVCSGFGDKSLYAVDVTGTGDVTDTHVKWSTDQQVPQSPTPVLVGDRIYMASDRGVLTCLDAADGTAVFRQRLGGNFSASPLYTSAGGGRMYWSDESGKTTVIAAADEYKELAVNEVGVGPTRLYATFAVFGDDLILRTDKAMYRIGR